MKKEDLTRFINAIEPGDELQARVLALPRRLSRPRLENPLKLAAAFGIAGLLCAGVVAVVLVLQNNTVPGGGLAAGPGAETASPADMQPSDDPHQTPWPSDDPHQTPAYTVIPQDSKLEKMTLPEVIISPDQAISIAKKAYKDYYGLDVEDCLVIDTCSYSQFTVYGTGELWEPLWERNAYAGKQILLMSVSESADMGNFMWAFVLQDGAYENIPAGTISYIVLIDAASGEVVEEEMGSMSGPMLTPRPSND